MPKDSSNLTQLSINERLNLLIKALDMSARAFSAKLGVPDSNTRNYLSKGTKLNADYLERIAIHFKDVSLNWLITGEGAPFLGTPPIPGVLALTTATKTRKSVNVAGPNHGTATQNNYGITDCEKERDTYRAERDGALKVIELLHAQLATKDKVIEAKDQYIQLLKETYRPSAD